MDNARACSSTRRRATAGLTLASAAILATSLVAVPPDDRAARSEPHQVRLAALSLTAPSVAAGQLNSASKNQPRLPLKAATTAAEDTGGDTFLSQLGGFLIFATLILGGVLAAGVVSLVVVIPAYPFLVVKELIGWATKALSGTPTAATAARRPTGTSAPARAVVATRSTGMERRRGNHAERPAAAAAATGPARRTARASVTLPARQHTAAVYAARSRPAAHAASATARKAPSTKGVAREHAAAR
jgi:hypothetical protein